MIASVEDSCLSEEQRELLQLASNGVSFFYTGYAGTGKTRTLLSITKLLQEKHGQECVGVTATTGLAATHIGGQTLHSWGWIGLGNESRYLLLEKIIANDTARLRWINCKTLIIDEISMLDQESFETLEFLARKIRNSKEPFGGIQLIVCGDFKQLPPVVRIKNAGKHEKNGKEIPFCFKSRKWDACIQTNLKLTTIFRQSDSTLLQLLEEVRCGGKLSNAVQNILESLKVSEESIIDPKCVFLFSLKRDVEGKNRTILSKIPGTEYVATATDTGVKDCLKDCPFPQKFIYKIGARVMLLRNIHNLGLANGSQGTVINVASDKPQVKFDSGTLATIVPYVWAAKNEDGVAGSRRQLPLNLSWALTIHRSQGQTLPSVAICLQNMFAYGQAYVALSRASSIDGLRILPGWDHTILETPKSVLEFEKSLRNAKGGGCIIKEKRQDALFDDDDELDNGMSSNANNYSDDPLNWHPNLALPPFVDLPNLLEKIEGKNCRRSENRQLCKNLLTSMTADDAFERFCSYCWDKIENIYVLTGLATSLEIKEAMSAKNYEEKTKRFAALQREMILKRKWFSTLKAIGLTPVGQARPHQNELMLLMDLLSELRNILIERLVDKVVLESGQGEVTNQLNLMSKELAKVRYLAGWTIFKVSSATHSYIQSNSGSVNKQVRSNVNKEIAVMNALKNFTSAREEALRSTRYPESLQHIELYNRGGLTHVNDDVYLFFVQLEKECQRKFSSTLIEKYARDGLKVARNLIKESPAVNIAWTNLLVSLKMFENKDPQQKDCTSSELILQRFLKRYLNMRTKEFLRHVRKEVKITKDTALRDALKKKKQKGKTSENLRSILQGLVDDTSRGKEAAHCRIKALALTDKAAFEGYTKGQLSFIFLLYDLVFLKSRKKKELSIELNSKIVAAERICRPDVATKGNMEKVLRLYIQGKRVDLHALSLEGVVPNNAQDGTEIPASPETELGATENVGNNENAEPAVRIRLTPFKPTREQEEILRRDSINHHGKVPNHLKDQRATEFGIQPSQIKRWHTSFNKSTEKDVGIQNQLT